jgi:hypothetical protein
MDKGRPITRNEEREEEKMPTYEEIQAIQEKEIAVELAQDIGTI